MWCQYLTPTPLSARLKFKGADAYLAGIEELTDDKLCQELRTHGVEAGPIVNTTRLLYQKKLAEAMANRAKGVAIWGDGGGGGGGSYGKWIMSCCIFGSCPPDFPYSLPQLLSQENWLHLLERKPV